MPPTNGSGQFHIDLAPTISARVKALHHAAVAGGRGVEFRAAFRRLLDRLRVDALTYGEPVYPLRALGLIVRKAVEPPIAVHYTVHPQRRVVWFSAIDVLD
jgi:hypothetical protein